MSQPSPCQGLSLQDILSVYALAPEQRAVLEVAGLTDSAEAADQLRPALDNALRALRDEANAEAAFNEKYRVQP
ncbi:hypothetical protein VRRI112168_00365 [Vreelandella rituensis]|uniref:Uncharacterized protein n=1 Tax=Vreelandella rituensis TaxID=2282306 RepID=A0A368U9R2_9GAMM|nr:hypothetical protein [Halomonas rituensis]RCV93850.1 hypothetical protein DU506_01445 [Halomonas rituensis]